MTVALIVAVPFGLESTISRLTLVTIFIDDFRAGWLRIGIWRRVRIRLRIRVGLRIRIGLRIRVRLWIWVWLRIRVRVRFRVRCRRRVYASTVEGYIGDRLTCI